MPSLITTLGATIAAVPDAYRGVIYEFAMDRDNAGDEREISLMPVKIRRVAAELGFQNRCQLKLPCSKIPLMMGPTGGGFSVPIFVVCCRQVCARRRHFCAPMPPLCHSLPSSFAPRVACEFGHTFAFGGAVQKYVRNVHR
jgi:hypothetical protein